MEIYHSPTFSMSVVSQFSKTPFNNQGSLLPNGLRIVTAPRDS